MPLVCTNTGGERGAVVQLRVTFILSTSPVWKLSQVELEYWEHFIEVPGLTEIQAGHSLSNVPCQTLAFMLAVDFQCSPAPKY